MRVSRLFATFSTETRSLTEGEIAMGRSVFGDTIDYERIRIHKSNKLFSKDADGMAPDHNIFFRPDHYKEDFSQTGLKYKSFFIHEMAHSWQAQNGKNPVRGVLGLYFGLFLKNENSVGGEEDDYNSVYAFDMPDWDDVPNLDISFFNKMNIEQQASFIEQAFYCREEALYFAERGLINEFSRPILERAALYEAVAERILPPGFTIFDGPGGLDGPDEDPNAPQSA